MKSTSETRATARAALDYIEANPEKHRQADFYMVHDDDGQPVYVGQGRNVSEQNWCNTTMCVAGTAVFIDGGIEALRDCDDFDHKGAELLGLDFYEGSKLFYTMDESAAVEMLKAVAEGDEARFDEVYARIEDDLYASH